MVILLHTLMKVYECEGIIYAVLVYCNFWQTNKKKYFGKIALNHSGVSTKSFSNPYLTYFNKC